MLAMETPVDDILLDPKEAARARGVSDQHQRKERCLGRGPRYMKDGKTGAIWYEWSELVRWAEEHNRRLRWPGEQRA